MASKKVPKRTCPHCGKLNTNGSHIRLCPKNPDKPDLMASVRDKTPDQSPASSEAESPSTPASASTPNLVAVSEPVAEASIPDFGPEPSPASPPPTAAPAAAQGTNPQPSPGIEMKPVVDVLCSFFDGIVRSGVEAPKAPGPPKPISESDKEMLARAYEAALMRYGGAASPFLEKWAPLINVIFVTLYVFGGRVMEARAYLKYQEIQKRAKRRPELADNEPEVRAAAPEQGADDAYEEPDVGRQVVGKLMGYRSEVKP